MAKLRVNNPGVNFCFTCTVRLDLMREINRLRAQNSMLTARNTKLEYAVRWVCGEMGDCEFTRPELTEQMMKRSGVLPKAEK